MFINYRKNQYSKIFQWTIKSVYNDHTRDQKFVADVDKWFFFQRYLYFIAIESVTVDRWLLPQVWQYLFFDWFWYNFSFRMSFQHLS